MKTKILITGGAGFIGSHLASELLKSGHSVRVLDKLDQQVHHGNQRPAYLDNEVELQIGDVCDRDQVKRALPLFAYPGSPDYRRLWGVPDDSAWERAVSYYLGRYGAFSDIRDQHPRPLDQLERMDAV